MRRLGCWGGLRGVGGSAWGLVGVAGVLGVWLVVCVCVAGAESPLSWAPGVRVDHDPPFALSVGVDGIACPSEGLCVAVDKAGDVLSSSGPLQGRAGWSKVNLGRYLTAVSCPTTSLCVAAGLEGEVFTSTQPAAGAAGWVEAHLREPGAEEWVSGISCPSTGLCVAVDNLGEVLVSSDPTGAAATWHATKLATGLRDVSCAAGGLCVAVGGEGEVFSLSDPAGGAGAWVKSTIASGSTQLVSVSCPSRSLCLSGDNSGELYVSGDPAGGSGAWHARGLAGGEAISSISCAGEALCLAAAEGKVLYSSDPGDLAAWAAAPIATGNASLESAACASAQLCLVGGGNGELASSSDPTGGSSAWRVSDLEVGYTRILGVSCTPGELCVAVDEAGNVSASLDPAGGAGAWRDAHVDGHPLVGVSCASMRLCVAVDAAGGVLSSSEPMGGASAWHLAPVVQERAFVSVACPSRRLCVGSTSEGYIASSSDPTGGRGAWHAVKVAASLGEVTCASVDLCLAIDGRESLVSSDPGSLSPGAWQPAGVPAAAVSCPSRELCVAAGGATVFSSSDPAVGRSWRSIRLEGLEDFDHISCSFTSLCVATANAINDLRGVVIASVAPTDAALWSASELYGGSLIQPPEEDFQLVSELLTGVSCMPHACVVVDDRGSAIVGEQPPLQAAGEPGQPGAPSTTGAGATPTPNPRPPSAPPAAGHEPAGIPLAVESAFTLERIQSIRGAAKLTLNLPGPGTLDITGRASLAVPHHARHTSRVIARLTLTVHARGQVITTLTPTRLARTTLADTGRLQATLTIAYTPHGGLPRSITRTVTFASKPRLLRDTKEMPSVTALQFDKARRGAVG